MLNTMYELGQTWQHHNEVGTADAKTIGAFLWQFHEPEQADDAIIEMCKQVVTVLQEKLAKLTAHVVRKSQPANSALHYPDKPFSDKDANNNHHQNDGKHQHRDNDPSDRLEVGHQSSTQHVNDVAYPDASNGSARNGGARNGGASDSSASYVSAKDVSANSVDGNSPVAYDGVDSGTSGTNDNTTAATDNVNDDNVANDVTDNITDDIIDVIRALVQTHITWANHLMEANLAHQAQTHLEQALEHLRNCPALDTSPLHYYLRAPLCICWYIDGRYPAVIDIADTGIAHAQRHGDLRYEARLRNTQGLAYRVLGEYRQAVYTLTTSQHLYERLNHPDAKHPTANLASLFHYLGREKQALAYFEQALELSQHHQLNHALTTAQLGDIHLEREDYTTALEHYRSTMNRLEANHTFAVLAVVLANAAIASIHLNQLTQADAYLQRAITLIASHPHKRYHMIIHYSLGLWQQAKGHYQDARSTLEDALERARAIDEKRFQTFIHEALAEVCAVLGDMAQAFVHERHFAKQQRQLLEQKHQRELAGLMLDVEIEREQHAREKAEYALKTHTELLERITDGFLAIDKDGIITYANHIISDLSGLARAELIGKHAKDCFPHVPKVVQQHYQNAVRYKRVTALEFYDDARQRWYDLRVYPSEVGSTVYLLDITTRKQQDSALARAHKQLEHAYTETAAKVDELEQLHRELEAKNHTLAQLSQQDGLTKLFNRRTLDALFAQEFQRATRYATPLSVMLCDIDNFKQVNDRLSHAVGDDVLRQIAVIFSQNTREQDIVARYGGEEFVIVFPETPLAATMQACENLRHLVASYPWSTIHPDLRVTLSMGVTDKQTQLHDCEAMLQAADTQMYRAKTSGKDRVCSVLRNSTLEPTNKPTNKPPNKSTNKSTTPADVDSDNRHGDSKHGDT